MLVTCIYLISIITDPVITLQPITFKLPLSPCKLLLFLIFFFCYLTIYTIVHLFGDLNFTDTLISHYSNSDLFLKNSLYIIQLLLLLLIFSFFSALCGGETIPGSDCYWSHELDHHQNKDCFR